MNNHEQHDWHDALIDRGLAEAMGGETPPDLSERILAAARTAAAGQVTLAQGAEQMNANSYKHKRSKLPWLGIAVAASICVVASALLYPPISASRRVAHKTESLAQVEKEALVREQRKNDFQSVSDSNDEAKQRRVLGESQVTVNAEDSELAGKVPATVTATASGRSFRQRAPAEEPMFESVRPTPSPYYLSDDAQPLSGQRPARSARDNLRLDNLSQPRDRLEPVDAPSGADRSARLREIDAQLAAKTSQLETLANEAKAAESPQADAGLGILAKEVASIQQQLIEAKAQSVEITLRQRQASSSADEARKLKTLAANNNEQLSKLAELLDEKYVEINNLGRRRGVKLAKLTVELKKLREAQQNLQRELGTGPGTSGDQYTRIQENPFIVAQGENAVSTFSIDVDTASYANVRQFLEQSRQLPPPDAVRIEELVNYFDYDYAGPTDERPFAAHMEVAGCPWNAEHRLVRIALKGREMDRRARPQSNLVFLIDVSGSMNEPNKLPLLIEGMKLLTRELGENDKVAIVVYASSEGLALPSTRGDQQQTILAALDRLRAGGSTAGGAGIQLAYQTAVDNFIKGGVNRVILCTDGDFNVGVTSTGALETLAETKAKETGVFLTVLGFGRGNLNDSMMEAVSGKGNGNYHYIDNLTEARKVLVEEMSGTLVTIAKDVKIQVEFNPAQVAGYRLIGYENRMLRTEDFNDDKKDAGEIGAGHAVTALYEIVPAGQEVSTAGSDPLKYQEAAKPRAASGELLTLKLRYKEPDGDMSTKLEFPLTDEKVTFADASEDFQFASAVASFGMLLRGSAFSGDATFDTVLETAQVASQRDDHGYRAEFLELVRLAKQLQQP